MSSAGGLRPGVRLAFDVGKARVGVARCDAEGILAVPVTTLRRDRYGADLQEAADLVEEHDAIEVVVGLPTNLRGKSTPSTKDARRWALELAGMVGPVAVRMVDERLTTVSAHQALHGAGLKERSFRAVVDQAAAVVILNQALEAERRSGAPTGELVNPTRRGKA